MKHLDLFSGIGGFALAADRVFGEVEHTFVEIDPFCQEVLKKHWPNSKIYGDIRTLTPDTKYIGRVRTKETREDSGTQSESEARQELSEPEPSGASLLRTEETRWDILTGGFPCQPFSQAGRRQGTEDDRYLWPEMFRVIRDFKPTWVIAENVRGLVTWNDGMVLEQVWSDLEAEGYEVQPLIIPAVGLNAPHRRERIWFIAQNTISERSRRRMEDSGQILGRKSTEVKDERSDWESHWLKVATELCRVDDGLPKRLDRNPRLKALGNAVVVPLVEEILKSIKEEIMKAIYDI